MVISWLFNAITKDLHDSVAYADTAHEIWMDLEERFLQDNAPRVHQLKHDLSHGARRALHLSLLFKA